MDTTSATAQGTPGSCLTRGLWERFVTKRTATDAKTLHVFDDKREVMGDITKSRSVETRREQDKK